MFERRYAYLFVRNYFTFFKFKTCMYDLFDSIRNDRSHEHVLPGTSYIFHVGRLIRMYVVPSLLITTLVIITLQHYNG